MGTETRIVIHAPTPADAESAARAAFDRIAALDRALSDYRVDSELESLADAAGGDAVVASDDLLLVLGRGLDLARETDGAFDPTAGPLTALWRAARRTGRPPGPALIDSARTLVDWRRVSIDTSARTVRLHTPGMRLDLGAIAKGYAADQALAALVRAGARRALVAIGGEIVVGDPPPGSNGWRIALANAAPPFDTVEIANAGLSASGDSEQFIDIDGVRHSHVIDPRTGTPLTHRVTATVSAPDGISADAWATAATVLDSAARAAFIARRPRATFRVLRLDEALRR